VVTAAPGRSAAAPVSETAAGRPRAVVLVGNPAAPYSRGLRIARTLVGEGFTVEIAAVAAPGLPAVEAGEGWTLRRYAPRGIWSRLGRSSGEAHGGLLGAAPEPVPPESQAREPVPPESAAPEPGEPEPKAPEPAAPAAARRRPPLRRAVDLAAAVRRWVLWPHTVRGWWATLARELPQADLYHATGSLAIAAALSARDRSPGPSGGRAIVIYDAVDDVFASNNVLDMPAPIRRVHERREQAWARRADARITVNDALADRLAARWGTARPVVVPNYPELPGTLGAAGAPGATGGDGGPAADGVRRAVGPLRRELGLGVDAPVVLFQGRLGPRLGLDEAAEAVLAVPGAVLAVVGFGRGYERERRRDAEPRFAGRHRTLPARHPDELLAWTADADVSIIPLPPVSENQRLSSPNKLWESLAAGTPVVVPAGLTLMADLVLAEDLGVVAASGRPGDLAAALDAALGRLRNDPAWRDRIRIVAAERHSWPVAAAGYVDLVRTLRGGGPG
jgi:glycosyltransferase involved in cell wall biosynthesis